MNSKTPFHLILKQYRVLYIIVTIFFLWLAWDAWDWFKISHEDMQEWTVAGFVSIYVTVIGVLKYVLENVRHDQGKD
jgi:FtsH-binding integral membrane protein|tara:strand:+ start:191 stop:421 length:231 start_codon:yes stop_codon:yes gene_type:complete